MGFLLRKIMITLKEHLENSFISVSEAQRFDLGYKIARIWDSQKKGAKTYKNENDFNVRTYPKEFLYSKSVTKYIVKYCVNEFDKLSNTF